MAFIAQSAKAARFNGQELLNKNEFEQAEILSEVLPTAAALRAVGVEDEYILSVDIMDFTRKVHVCRGELYRKRDSRSTTSNINGAWSLQSMWVYALEGGQFADPYHGIEHTPFESVAQFVASVREAGNSFHSAFVFPSRRIQLQQQIETSLHFLPPGMAVVVKNAKPAPHGWTEGVGKITDVYHGTLPSSTIPICAKGFGKTYGAGFHQLYRHFGVPVGGVYFAPTLSTAMRYPMGPGVNSNPVFESKQGIPGGELIAQDGTMPMRCIFRCLVDVDDRLYKKDEGSNQQALFKPADVYISHLIFIAVPPRYTIAVPRTLSTYKSYAQTDFDNKAIEQNSKFFTTFIMILKAFGHRHGHQLVLHQPVLLQQLMTARTPATQ